MKIPAGYKKIDLLNSLLLVVILLITVILYFPALDYGWILGTDQLLVIENSLVASLSLNNVIDCFLSAPGGRYQPLVFISYMIDIGISGDASLKTLHLVNLLLHLLNTLLLFRIIQLLSRRTSAAIIAAALFALHPANSEAVIWISSRSQLLAGFFMMSGVLSYLYYLSTEKRKLYYMSLVFFLFSIFTNPIGVMLPVVLIFTDLYRGNSLRLTIINKLPLLITSIVFLVSYFFIAERSDYPISDELPSFGLNSVLVIYGMAQLLLGFILPLKQTAFHPYPEVFNYEVILGSLALLIFLLFLYYFFRKNKHILYLLSFFLLASAISFISSFHELYFFQESQAYVPYLGLFMVFGLFFDSMLKKYSSIIKARWIFIFFLLTVLTLYALQDFRRIGIWENNISLWSDVIETYPDNDHAYFMRGDYWAMSGDFEKAKFDYNQCIRKNKNAYQAINNIGLIYMEEGELRLALGEFQESIRIRDDFYKSHLNLGLTYMRIGRNDLALENISRAIALNSDEAISYYNRGLVYQRTNELEKAVSDFSKAIELDPYRVIFYKDRGKAYVWLRQFANAEMDYTKALDLNPSDAEMWFRRSLTRVSQDNYEGGLEDAVMAKSLGYEVEEEYIKGLTVEVLKGELPLPE